MPSTTHESSTKENIGRSGFLTSKESIILPDVLHIAQNERLVLDLSKKFGSLAGLEIPKYGKVDYYFPSAKTIVDSSQVSEERQKWLKSMGLEVISIKANPNEKLSEFNTRIFRLMTERYLRLEARKLGIHKILFEKFKINSLNSQITKSLVGSSEFILNYLEAQNIKGRNDFSILELASGDIGERGYDQKGELYVPLVCEILTRSGFAVDGIDRYNEISSQNLDFGKVQNIDLTSDTWEESVKRKYNLVIFLRNWHSEIFLQRYRQKSKVIVFETDFLVEDFIRNLLPKVYDILEDNGVFFATNPFKKKDLFDVDVIFARFHLEVFYNLDGLILARKKTLVME